MEQAPKPGEAPKPKNRSIMLAVIIIVILVVVGVGVYIITRPPPTPPPSGPQVAIKDDGTACINNDAACEFTPFTQNATVNGPAVVWTNAGTTAAGHTVTTCDTTNGSTSAECPSGMDATGLDSFSLSIAKSGSPVSHVFTKTGVYYYYCAIHPSMHGIINVTAT